MQWFCRTEQNPILKGSCLPVTQTIGICLHQISVVILLCFIKNTVKQHCSLNEKVAIYCEEDNGMEVDAETHDDLKIIVVNNSATVVGLIHLIHWNEYFGNSRNKQLQ